MKNIKSNVVEFFSAEEEEKLRLEINKLPFLVDVDNDIHRQLVTTAQIGIQNLIEFAEQNYRKKYGVKILPKALWRLLRIRAHLCYVRHCAHLMRDLKTAAFDPNREI